jgi:hypothetical protein
MHSSLLIDGQVLMSGLELVIILSEQHCLIIASLTLLLRTLVLVPPLLSGV